MRLFGAETNANGQVLKTQTLIVGGGLSGLALAERLEDDGQDFVLIEARDTLGGRISSKVIGGESFDLGPTWFWAGQPRIARLLSRLGLDYHEQYCSGQTRIENQDGTVQSVAGFAPMQGSLRINGGVGALIDALSSRVPEHRILTSTCLHGLALEDTKTRASASSAGEQTEILADRVVLAIPPRVASATLTFAPALPVTAHQTMRGIPTWMAGQAKVVAVYERPFWRDAGLSGDAMSRRGPMVEIHDASPAKSGPYALFGFVGIPPEIRATHREEVEEMARLQFVNIFGSALERPLSLTLQDWAQEPYTATQDDQTPVGFHPAYGLPAALENLWDGRLMLGSTEVAKEFGGYLEGALEAAEQVLANLRSGTA